MKITLKFKKKIAFKNGRQPIDFDDYCDDKKKKRKASAGIEPAISSLLGKRFATKLRGHRFTLRTQPDLNR